jgi:hypothetical protein
VFTKENLNNCPNKGNSPYQTMSDIKINCKGVTKLLKNQGPFHQSLVQIGPVASEELIKM